MTRRVILLCCFTLSILSGSHLFAGEIDKNKLKLSLDYENFSDAGGNEIGSPGLTATYFISGRTQIGDWGHVLLDVQSGARTSLYREFESGNLPGLFLSNRVQSRLLVPFREISLGGYFYFRNKWLSNSGSEDAFVDLFGGVGFVQAGGGAQAAWKISSDWELAGTTETFSTRFAEFDESNSEWNGVSLRLSRKVAAMRWSVHYRIRSIDYNRPVTGAVVVPASIESTELQHDRFQEVGLNAELYRGMYVSGGYFYQINDSNSPGFSFRNHRFNILVGAELRTDVHFQAYVILQQQNFPEEFVILPFPIVIDDFDSNTLAASLLKSLNKKWDLEFALQRYTHHSSFQQLNASKWVLYSALHLRL